MCKSRSGINPITGWESTPLQTEQRRRNREEQNWREKWDKYLKEYQDR